MGMEWATTRRVYRPHRVNRQIVTVTVCWLMQRHDPWYSKHFTLSQSESMFVPQALWKGVRRPKYLTIWPPLLSISTKNQATLMHHICSQKYLVGTYTGLSACMVSDLATRAIIPIYPYCLAAKNGMIKMFRSEIYNKSHAANIADQNSTNLSCHFPSQSGRSVGRAISLTSLMPSSTLGPWTLTWTGETMEWCECVFLLVFALDSTLHQLESFEASEPSSWAK